MNDPTTPSGTKIAKVCIQALREHGRHALIGIPNGAEFTECSAALKLAELYESLESIVEFLLRSAIVQTEDMLARSLHVPKVYREEWIGEQKSAILTRHLSDGWKP